MRQLAAHDALESTEEDYYALCECKTASLMAAACELGAMVGDPRHRAALTAYGRDLGMAFQIVDDLIDYTVSADITGKPHGLDLREHKVTLPLIAALPKMDRAGSTAVSELFEADEPPEGLVETVVQAVTNAGGLDYARQRARHYAQAASRHLESIPDDPFARILRLTVDFVLERQK
jgi:octaprenyl-diphosphate synthase